MCCLLYTAICHGARHVLGGLFSPRSSPKRSSAYTSRPAVFLLAAVRSESPIQPKPERCPSRQPSLQAHFLSLETVTCGRASASTTAGNLITHGDAARRHVCLQGNAPSHAPAPLPPSTRPIDADALSCHVGAVLVRLHILWHMHPCTYLVRTQVCTHVCTHAFQAHHRYAL